MKMIMTRIGNIFIIAVIGAVDVIVTNIVIELSLVMLTIILLRIILVILESMVIQ